MQIRRPLAALLTALALFGGGATLSACGGPTTPNEGTTDDEGGVVNPEDNDPAGDEENLPDNTDPEQGQDLDEDTTDPD